MKRLVIIGLLCALCVSVAYPEDKPKPNGKQQVTNDRINELIKQLGNDDFNTREKAQKELEEIGEAAQPALEVATKSNDPEISSRASRVLSTIWANRLNKRGIKFSDAFLKILPNIYRIFDSLKTDEIFTILQKITVPTEVEIENGRFTMVPPPEDLTNQDIMNLISKIPVEKALDLTWDQKDYIIMISTTGFKRRGDGPWRSWHSPIPELMPYLRQFAKDKDFIIRASALEEMWEIGGKEIYPEVIKLLNDEEDENALYQFFNMRNAETMAEFIKLSPKKLIVRIAAVVGFHTFLGRKDAPELVRLLNDGDDQAKLKVIYAFWHDLDYKKVTDQDALKLLNDNDAQIRIAAIKLLSGQLFKEATPELIKLLKDENYRVRFNAIRVLDINEIPPETIRDLLKDKNKKVLAATIRQIEYLTDAKAYIPRIKELLTDEDSDVRSDAIDSLNKLGVKDAIPEIRKLLKDKDCVCHCSSIQALGELGDKESIPEIRKFLKDKVSRLQRAASRALGELNDKGAIPDLLNLIKDNDERVIVDAIFALGKLGSKEVIPEILDSLKKPSRMIPYAVVTAMVELGAKDRIPKEMLGRLRFIKDIIKYDKPDPIYDYEKRAEAALKELGVEVEEK